jgi:hypothetical protein
MQCQAEQGVPNFTSITMVRIPDDGVLEATCNRGHRTFTIIQQMKFELLSDMAIKAIVDGYYRDAVASFAGALERLHEFLVRATCRKQGVSAPPFDRAWKEMSNQSERQLGAFIGAHLLETGQPPMLLHQNQTKFRNDVIHKGMFPSRHDTLRFGQAVSDCALPILRLLRSEPYSAVVQTLVMDSIHDRSKPAWEAGQRTSTLSINTFLSLNNADTHADVDSAVASYAARPDFGEAIKFSQQLGAIIDAALQAAGSLAQREP